MDRFLCIEAFVRVAETSSFAEAARQLGVTSSVVTTRIQQLEKFVNAPLFHRSTRHVRLSEVGEAFYRECSEVVGRVNELTDQMRELRATPTGRLRIQMCQASRSVTWRAARGIRTGSFRHPARRDRQRPRGRSDPRGLRRRVPDFPAGDRGESLIERRLFTVRRLFCATPAYIRTAWRAATSTRPAGTHHGTFYVRLSVAQPLGRSMTRGDEVVEDGDLPA